MIPREHANVPEFLWQPVSPLAKVFVPRRWDDAAPMPSIRLLELTGFSLALVMARRGRWAETASAALRWYGVEPPTRPAAVTCRTATLIWSGPHQFMALSPDTGLGSVDALRANFVRAASVSEQSDGRSLIQLSGPRVRDCLAKLCSADLHEQVFPAGAAATISIAHSAVNMWRCADGADRHPVFNILLFASFAESVWHTVVEAAAEYAETTN
jgi:methylglutamate dehydrogenase subunit D